MKYDVWTDGGCSGNPGPGGWAFIVTDSLGNGIGEGKGGARGTGTAAIRPDVLIPAWGKFG